MGRPKKFTREEVLKKAMPVFWKRGFADTGLHDLEKATGVNKSGLYAEFKDKEDLFLACLRYYLESGSGQATLAAKPLGWGNIEKLMRMALVCSCGQKGCFAINSMREFAILPPKAHELVSESNAQLKRLLEKNIRAERAKADPGAIAEMVSTFLSGLCVEQNLKTDRASSNRKIDSLMRFLRSQ
jgi:TetR/AcrR family transcriptional regulator, copper-responsive repressor